LYWLLFFDLRHQIAFLSFFFWSLYWLSFFDLQHQIAPFVIFLLVIVLVVILRPTASDCPSCHFSFGHCIGSYSSTYGIRLPLLSFFFWSLYWLLFFDLRHQIAPFVIFLLVIVLVVILRPTASDCPSCHFSFGHCIGCHSSTYGIRLPLLSFFFWSLYWLSFFDLRYQIAPFVIFLLVIVMVVILRPTASDCPFYHFSFNFNPCHRSFDIKFYWPNCVLLGK
jgi:hypothetical protein